jgi:hypothetical protein
MTSRRSPGEAGTKTGASRPFYVEGVPHAVIVLQGRRLERALNITVQCKTRELKREAPEGTDFSGAMQGQ